MADILENAAVDLTPLMRDLINALWSEWKTVEQQIDELSDELEVRPSEGARLQPIAVPIWLRDRRCVRDRACRSAAIRGGGQHRIRAKTRGSDESTPQAFEKQQQPMLANLRRGLTVPFENWKSKSDSEETPVFLPKRLRA